MDTDDDGTDYEYYNDTNGEGCKACMCVCVCVSKASPLLCGSMLRGARSGIARPKQPEHRAKLRLLQRRTPEQASKIRPTELGTQTKTSMAIVVKGASTLPRPAELCTSPVRSERGWSLPHMAQIVLLLNPSLMTDPIAAPPVPPTEGRGRTILERRAQCLHKFGRNARHPEPGAAQDLEVHATLCI